MTARLQSTLFPCFRVFEILYFFEIFNILGAFFMERRLYWKSWWSSRRTGFKITKGDPWMKVLARRTIKYCTLKCFFDKNQNLSAVGWFNRKEGTILIQMFRMNLKTSDCLNALWHHILPTAIKLLMAVGGCCLHLPFLSLSSYPCFQRLPPPWSHISNRRLVVCGLETHLHLNLCSVWAQRVPDHLMKLFGRSDHLSEFLEHNLMAIQLQKLFSENPIT